MDILKQKYSNLIVLLASALVCMFSACVNDDDELQAVVEIGNIDMQDVNVVTRASVGYSDFDASKHVTSESVLYGFIKKDDSNSFTKSTSEYSTNSSRWISGMRVKTWGNYTVCSMLTDIEDLRSSVALDEGVPTMTIENVPSIASGNILVSRASAQNNSFTDGNYKVQLDAEKHQVNFKMDNLMCRLNLRFKIGYPYSELRYIVLKEVVLSSASGRVTNTVTVSLGSSQSTAIFGTGNTGVEYTVLKDSTITVGSEHVLYRSSDSDKLKGTLLTGDYYPFTSCYLIPLSTLSNDLTMTVIYDVYNMKGICTRSGGIATNKLSSVLRNGIVQNNDINLNITVQPTYLYVLSDGDLDNPGLNIETGTN